MLKNKIWIHKVIWNIWRDTIQCAILNALTPFQFLLPFLLSSLPFFNVIKIVKYEYKECEVNTKRNMTLKKIYICLCAQMSKKHAQTTSREHWMTQNCYKFKKRWKKTTSFNFKDGNMYARNEFDYSIWCVVRIFSKYE